MADGYLISINNMKNLEPKHYNLLVNTILMSLNARFNFEYPSEYLTLDNGSRLYMLKLQGKAIKRDKKEIVDFLEQYKTKGIETRVMG